MWDRGFSIQDRKQVFGTAIEAPWHWFINLTKQPQNIPVDLAFPKNWVQGVSVCNKADLWRIKDLAKTKAKLKIVSFEPLYEHLGLTTNLDFDWMIIGGQTHPLKLPERAWVAQLIHEAKCRGIPVFIKNNLSSYGFDFKEYPARFGMQYCEKEKVKP
jgi:protein gp37